MQLIDIKREKNQMCWYGNTECIQKWKRLNLAASSSVSPWKLVTIKSTNFTPSLRGYLDYLILRVVSPLSSGDARPKQIVTRA